MAELTVNNKFIENFQGWSYTEDITGRDPNSYTGGTGQLTFSTVDFPGSRLFLDKALSFKCVQGVMQGTIRTRNKDANQNISYSADDVMLQLKKYVVSRAQVDRTLTQVMTYFASLIGFTIGVDVPIRNRIVTVTGFEGNFYDRFKEFLSAKGLAMRASGTGILVVDAYTIPAKPAIENVTENGLNDSLQDSCRKVEVGYYQHRKITNAQIYPQNYSNLGDSIQLESGEVVEVVLEVDATLTTVNQPLCVTADSLVGPYDGTVGRYAVIGGDTGTDIMPSWWNSNGGMVEVRINPESTSVTVVVTAPTSDLYAPYTITADPEMNWSGLYITGTGSYHKYEPITITTGASATATNEDIGVQVDNPFISSATEAYNAGFFTAAAANYVSTRNVATTSEVIGSFDTFLGNQVQYDDSKYRIESLVHGADGNVQIAMTDDTRSSDFDAVFSGLTATQMGTQYAGLTALDVSLQPLKRI